MLLQPPERIFAETVRRLAYANPFDYEEQAAVRRELAAIDLGLADEERKRPPVGLSDDPFLATLVSRTEALLLALLARARAGTPAAADDVLLLEDLIISAIYSRHLVPLNPLEWLRDDARRVEGYPQFRDELKQWTAFPFALTTYLQRPEHAFAINFQYRLAVALLKELIRGESRPVQRLRAATWHSIFPRELRLYGVLLYERMHEVTTLILGPSGTGKELVATAIGLARFVKFDAKRQRFVEPFAGAFHAINLSAMPRDLIESEMFGHVAGAFTGATKDREGWFEKCKRGHTVFLDELGELAEPVQVRLLRVLQSREFYRVGDAQVRRFDGRVIAATNRDLATQMAAGIFREDLYFRLNSDVIRTPTLREQLDDSPQELATLVTLVARRCLGSEALEEYVAALTQATLGWIERSPEMGFGYGWPGNFRELEQCVRSVMVRGEYHPPLRPASPVGALSGGPQPAESTWLDRFASELRSGSLTFDDLLERYCSLIFAKSGNVAEAARRLKKHRATVQGRIKAEWVERFRGGK